MSLGAARYALLALALTAALPACSSGGAPPCGDACPVIIGGCGYRGFACPTDAPCCDGPCVYGVCTIHWGPDTCADDYDCDSSGRTGGICHEGACVLALRPDGEPCLEGRFCSSGGCEGDPAVCAPARCDTLGEPCAVASECCAGLGCRGGVCVAECTPRWEPCTADDECCSGSECRGSSCLPVLSTLEQACDGAAENFCEDLSGCVGTACLRGCGTTPPDGGDCEIDGDCCRTQFCDAGTCRTCRWMCTSDAMCCHGAGSCVAGECATARCRDWRDCASGSRCRDGRCDVVRCVDPGDACVEGRECCSGVCEASHCVVPSSGSCTVDAQCTAPAVCLPDGSCGPPGGLGALCSRDAQCEAGRMCSSTTSGGRCRAHLGEPCTGGGVCDLGTSCGATGLCCRDATCTADGDCCNAGESCRVGTGCCDPLGAACTAFSCCGDPGLTCRAGRCCQLVGSTCGASADCCSGPCVGGVCACAPLGGGCAADAECCAPGLCRLGAPRICCLAPDAPCATGAECCSGTCRTNGRCS